MVNHPEDAAVKAEVQQLLVVGDEPAALGVVRALAANAKPPLVVVHLDEIKDALAHEPMAPVLALVRLPFDRLRKAFCDGEAPLDALDVWCSESEALLSACRKTRRWVVVMDAGMLTADPAACAEALGDRLNVLFGPVPAALADPRPDLSPIHAMIAATLVIGDDRTLRLADEIEAMSDGPVGARIPGLDDVSAAAMATTDLAGASDLLRNNLTHVLAEAGRFLDAKTALEAQSAPLYDAVADKHLLNAQLGAVNRLLEEAQEAHGLREAILGAEILQLGATNRRIEEARRLRERVIGGALLQAAAQSRDERDRLAADLKAARDEIARVRASMSWKLTKPMRALGRGFKRR